MRTRKIGFAALVAIALYGIAFAVLFEPQSYPCRTRGEWIGPKLRFDSAYNDIGKVLEYGGGRNFAYVAFQPLCRIWLFANGLT